MAKANLDKEFVGLFWSETTGHGTYTQYSYSIDGGAWLAASPQPGQDGYNLPARSHGKRIAFKIVLSGASGGLSPRVDDVSITWRTWTGKESTDKGNGTHPGALPRAGVPR